MFNKLICFIVAILATINTKGQCVGCPKSLTAPSSISMPLVGFNGHTSEVTIYDGSTPNCYLPVSNSLNGHLQGINLALCALKTLNTIQVEKDSIALLKIDSIINVINQIKDSLPNNVGIISSDSTVIITYVTIGDSTTYNITTGNALYQNGLIKNGSTIKQGGTLIENTYINGSAFNYSIKKVKGLNLNADTVILSAGDSTLITQGIYFQKDKNAFLIGNNVFGNKNTIDNVVFLGDNISTSNNKEGIYIGSEISSIDNSTSKNIVIGDSIDVINSTSGIIAMGNNLSIDQRSGNKTIASVGDNNNLRNENIDLFVVGNGNIVDDAFSKDICGGFVYGNDNTIRSSTGYIGGINNTLKDLGVGYIVGDGNLISDKVGGYIFGANDTIIGDGFSPNKSALLIGANIKTIDPVGYVVFNTDNTLAGRMTNTKIATDFANTFTVNANQYKLYTNTSGMVGVSLDKNDVAWNVMCDSTIKKNFKPVDYKKLYNEFKKTDINTWALKIDTLGSKRYVGVFAQTFYNLMDKGLGIKTKTNKSISQVNMDGVLMSLIKQQAILIDELTLRIQNLEKQKKQTTTF